MNFMCVIWTKEISFDNLTRVVFWTKGELFYKNLLKRSVLKSQFQNTRNLDEQNWFFHNSRKNNFKFTTEQKIDEIRFHYSYQQSTRFFYNQRFFSSKPQRCLTFSWIEHQMLLRCFLIHISVIILR